MNANQQSRWVRLALAAAALGVLAGCSGPRIVQGISSRSGKMKFVYAQAKFLAPETGVVECNAGQDGELSSCKPLQLTFVEE